MRRAMRTATPVVGVAMLASLLAACGGSAEGQPTSTTACPKPLPAPAKKIKPSTIYLNVINASSKAGLAGDTGVQFKWRGFRVLETGNQSVNDNASPATAEIRYGSSGRQIALTVAQQIVHPVLVKDDRSDPTVDVVLGEKFKLQQVPPPPAKMVTANVYNTTFRTGLSGQVAKQLAARGFKIKENGNDPGRTFLPNDTVMIRHGERGEPAARRMQLQFKGAKLLQDNRTDTTVDVVLLGKYKDLVPEAQATPPPTKKPSVPAGC